MAATLLEFPIMTTQLEKYPNRIRELRKACGLTQAELGDRIGISSVHVGHLELGRRELSLSMMQAIARALAVETVELLAPADNPLAGNPRSRRLLTHWAGANEPGRLAIERVAESMVGYRGESDIAGAPDRLASPESPTADRKKRQVNGNN